MTATGTVKGKVAILTPTDPSETARALGEAGFEPAIAQDGASLRDALAGAVGLVIGSGFYKQFFDIISSADDLRFIQLSAAGYEVVDELGAPVGVQVARAEGIWGKAVAGHALALTLCLLRRLSRLGAAQAEGQWCRAQVAPELASLSDRNVLVLGYGDIGSAIASYMEVLGARVSVLASRARAGGPAGGIHGLDRLDELLPRAEVLISALPAMDATNGLLDRKRLARLPADAILVNVGRGEVLDEIALVDALHEGALGGAALDVFRTEPLPAGSPLWSAPDLLITPHVAPLGDRRALRMLAQRVVENAQRALDGKDMAGRIDTGS